MPLPVSLPAPLAAALSVDLVEALIAGLCESPPWSTFVARLREAVAADYASFVFRPPVAGGGYPGIVQIYAGEASPPLVGRFYREALYARDPMPYRALDAGRVYALPELLDAADPLHEAYRRDLLVPSGMNFLRMMRFEAADGGSGWLIASRRHDDFGGRDEALLAALGTPLAAALTAHVARERERTQARVAGDAFQRMNFGWLTLDGAGRVLDADDRAEAMLADPEGHLLRGRDGRLQGRRQEVADAIAGSLRSARPAARRTRAVVLARQPWVDMLLVPLVPGGDDVREAAALAVYIHADRWSAADYSGHLGALFGLTPREAAMAMALARGLSIAEAAAELTLSIGSARTYTKRIYAKTGARGQADLVRFIHGSVTRLAGS